MPFCASGRSWPCPCNKLAPVTLVTVGHPFIHLSLPLQWSAECDGFAAEHPAGRTTVALIDWLICWLQYDTNNILSVLWLYFSVVSLRYLVKYLAPFWRTVAFVVPVCVLFISPLLVAAGFDQVFPMEKLFLFSPTELQMILCGDQSPQWTKDDIINYTEPKLGYTRERSVDVL